MGMVQEADGSLLGLWDGLRAASGDSAPKLFSCISGFSVSAVTQNTLKKAGCCLFKFLKRFAFAGLVLCKETCVVALCWSQK